jgi:hypothetical protein
MRTTLGVAPAHCNIALPGRTTLTRIRYGGLRGFTVSQSSKGQRLPDPTSRGGALFYAVAGGLIVAVIAVIAHHIHIVIS